VTAAASERQDAVVVDPSLLTTVIATGGTLLGALGGVGLTYRGSARQDAVQAGRRLQEGRTQERRQAYLDLMGAATQFRVEVVMTGQRHWKDMNLRLAAMQQHATAAGMQASRIALLAGDGVGEAAQAIAREITALAATTARQTHMGYQEEQFLGGEVTGAVDFSEFDRCIERFLRVAREAEK
jgi:hypothetical protein